MSRDEEDKNRLPGEIYKRTLASFISHTDADMQNYQKLKKEMKGIFSNTKITKTEWTKYFKKWHGRTWSTSDIRHTDASFFPKKWEKNSKVKKYDDSR